MAGLLIVLHEILALVRHERPGCAWVDGSAAAAEGGHQRRWSPAEGARSAAEAPAHGNGAAVTRTEPGPGQRRAPGAGTGCPMSTTSAAHRFSGFRRL